MNEFEQPSPQPFAWINQYIPDQKHADKIKRNLGNIPGALVQLRSEYAIFLHSSLDVVMSSITQGNCAQDISNQYGLAELSPSSDPLYTRSADLGIMRLASKSSYDSWDGFMRLLHDTAAVDLMNVLDGDTERSVAVKQRIGEFYHEIQNGSWSTRDKQTILPIQTFIESCFPGINDAVSQFDRAAFIAGLSQHAAPERNKIDLFIWISHYNHATIAALIRKKPSYKTYIDLIIGILCHRLKKVHVPTPYISVSLYQRNQVLPNALDTGQQPAEELPQEEKVYIEPPQAHQPDFFRRPSQPHIVGDTTTDFSPASDTAEDR